MKQLNACRMYLQVTTLAEITDHTGQTLLPHALSSATNPTPRGLSNISHSLLQWPQIALPSPICWRFWSKTICSIYTGTPKGMQLSQPLGRWHDTHSATRFWHWQMYDNTHLLYRTNANAPTRAALPTLQQRNLMKFSPMVPTSMAFTGPPITPLDPNTGYIKLPMQPIELTKTAKPNITPGDTLARQFRQQMPQWQRPMFGSIRKAGNTKSLLRQFLAQRPLMIISDASVQKNGNSGFAWVIAQDASTMWHGLGLTPGPVEDMYSGRAEAYGLLAAVTFLQYYLKAFEMEIPLTTVQCFCDNAGILTNLNTLHSDPVI